MSVTGGARFDVHQHLWPEPFVDALRSRRECPRLDGSTLLLDGAAPFELDFGAHDVGRRAAQAEEDGLDAVLIAASAVLGLADLPPDEAGDLAAAWHDGALALGPPFLPWATAGLAEPDVAALEGALAAGCVGLELPATALATPAALEALGPLLRAVEVAGRALLVHPGPVRPATPASAPAWWDPVVAYVGQLHAAWWAWAEAGRSSFPSLRICFCALAGLAPLHRERHRARGGRAAAVDPGVFVETSCYGTEAIDATIRALGIDVICNGSDRPYAEPVVAGLGESAAHAMCVVNPGRLVAQPVFAGAA